MAIPSTMAVFPGRAKAGIFSLGLMGSFADGNGIGEIPVAAAQRIDQLPQRAVVVCHAYAQRQRDGGADDGVLHRRLAALALHRALSTGALVLSTMLVMPPAPRLSTAIASRPG